MMGMGMSLTLDDFKRVTKFPTAVIVGVFCQVVLLPLMALFIVSLFDLDPVMSSGIMILAFCPGGASSNMISFLAKADLALSVTLTAITSLITPLIIPLLVSSTLTHFMGESSPVKLPLLGTVAQLLAVTVIPIAIGIKLNSSFPSLSKKLENSVKVFSFVFLFIIIGVVINKNWANVDFVFKSLAPIAITLSSINLAAGYFVAKLVGLNQKQSRTIGIEVGIQNGTIALMITGTLLGNTEMSLAPATYGLVMYFTGFLFAGITKYLSKNEEILEVINP